MNPSTTIEDKLMEAVWQLKTPIDCPGCTDPMHIQRALKRLLDEHPECFWFEGRWKGVRQGDGIRVHPLYTVAADAVPAGRRALDAAAEAVCRRYAGAADAHAFARAVYAWFLENVAYDLTVPGQTAYDALVSRRAVCKGISKGYQMVLRRAGIAVRLQDGALGREGRHIWNVALLDGVRANIDVSCGYPQVYALLPPEARAESYFDISDADLARTHTLRQGL